MTDTAYLTAYPQQMMTLSAIAYADENHPLQNITSQVTSQLADPSTATAGRWRLVWGPAQIDQTLMYCAQETVGSGRFALVIRGTDFLAVENWLQDLWVGQTDFRAPAGVPPGLAPKVSHGTMLGLQHLVDMYNGATPHLFDLVHTQSPGRSLREFFIAQAAARHDLDIVVTGHSMGGCLASAFAVWLADHLTIARCPIAVSVCTFAAPTAGNADFARYADLRLGAHHARYFNALDVVPLAWNEVARMRETPVPMTIGDDWAVPILAGLEREVRALGYAQPGTPYPLTRAAGSDAGGWLHLIGVEHAASTYLSLLNAPPLTVAAAASS